MASRSIPNEAVCPVPVEFLSMLLRSTERYVAEQVEPLPALQRAALAGFCYSRAHLRSLAFVVAGQCDVVALRRMTGTASDALIEGMIRPEMLAAQRSTGGARIIPLASFAA